MLLLPPTGQRGSRKEEEGQEGGWDHIVENSESQAKGLASLELLKQEHGVIRAQCQGDQPGVGGEGRKCRGRTSGQGAGWRKSSCSRTKRPRFRPKSHQELAATFGESLNFSVPQFLHP